MTNKRPLSSFVTLVLLAAVCASASPASAALVISFDETYATVSNEATSNVDDQFNTGGTTATTTLPGYSSTTTSLFTPGSMTGSFVQSRLGDYLGYSNGAVVTQFTTDVPMTYSAAGSYSTSSGGVTRLNSYLLDLTTSSFVFHSLQESSGGPAAFTLGGADGNYMNDSIGSLTGTIPAGNYVWYAQGYTYALYSADDGATASGEVSITFGPAAVPEASSVIVWSLLALTIGGAGWWQRSKLAT